MYVQREKEKETERASEAHTSSKATSRKILALPTGLVGASNNVTLCLCDPVDQPSANMCANLCPAHLKSDRIFSKFC